MPTADPDGRRLWRLDVLRAIAALSVIVSHSAYEGEGLWPPLAAVARAWRSAGWAGVDLFFVLSGFLVSGLLFREWRRTGRVRAVRFLIRRAFRIYPAFYVYLAVIAPVFLYLRLPLSAWALPTEVFFLQSYFYGNVFLGHTWSMAVEEHFYLLLALGFVLGARRIADRRWALTVWGAVALATLVARFATSAHWPLRGEQQFWTHLRLDSLMAGVAISYLVHWGYVPTGKLSRIVMAVGAALLLSPLLWWRAHNPHMQTFGYSLLWAGFGIIVLLASTPVSERGPTRIEAALAYVGRHSYSIYLWHIPLYMALLKIARPMFLEPSLAHMAEWVGLCVLLGVVMAKAVEFPMLRLRERWYPN